MKRFLALCVLSLSTFAQTGKDDALYLSGAQIKRLEDTQARIEILSAQLDAAKKAQEIELLKIQMELGALPDKYEPLSQIDGKLGFKRKAEPQGAGKAVTP